MMADDGRRTAVSSCSRLPSSSGAQASASSLAPHQAVEAKRRSTWLRMQQRAATRPLGPLHTYACAAARLRLRQQRVGGVNVADVEGHGAGGEGGAHGGRVAGGDRLGHAGHAVHQLARGRVLHQDAHVGGGQRANGRVALQGRAGRGIGSAGGKGTAGQVREVIGWAQCQQSRQVSSCLERASRRLSQTIAQRRCRSRGRAANAGVAWSEARA